MESIRKWRYEENQMDRLDMKHTISEIKNTPKGINNRLRECRGMDRQSGDRVVEIIQSE